MISHSLYWVISIICLKDSFSKKADFGGTWLAQLVKHLPSAQVMIPGFWDRVLHQAPCLAGSLLLPFPLLLLIANACTLSIKLKKIFKKSVDFHGKVQNLVKASQITSSSEEIRIYHLHIWDSKLGPLSHVTSEYNCAIRDSVCPCNPDLKMCVVILILGFQCHLLFIFRNNI